ncbi:MAG: ABC transporter permease subunit, partial [Actinomycetota bacterium]
MSTTAPQQSFRLRVPRFALALPSIFWYTAFFVVPILLVVVYSFGTKDSSKLVPVDFSNPSTASYGAVFDETFFQVFRSTVRISITATLLCLLIGLPVAYFAAFKVTEKWRAIVLAAVVVPSFTSFLIRTVAWRIPLAPNGVFSKWLQDIGLVGDKGIQILETAGAVQLAIVYNYLGFMILPLYVAFDRIDIRLREASKDLGAGRFSTFFSVTLPLAGPGIAAGVLLTFIPMCGDYVTATVLGGAKGNMIGAMIASQFNQAQHRTLASAMAVLMIAAVLLTPVVCAQIVWLVPQLLTLIEPVTQARRRARASKPRKIGSEPSTISATADTVLHRTLGVWTSLVLVFLFIPVALVFLHSFNRGNSFTIWSYAVSTQWWGELFDGAVFAQTALLFAAIVVAALVARRVLKRRSQFGGGYNAWIVPSGLVLALVVNGLITSWYANLFDFSGIGDAIRNSFLAALGATIIAVLLGGTAGVALARRPGRWSTAFMVVVFLILVTPEIMEAVALATWFPRIQDLPIVGHIFTAGWGPFNGGMNKLWVGQSMYSSAVVTLIVRARLAG